MLCHCFTFCPTVTHLTGAYFMPLLHLLCYCLSILHDFYNVLYFEYYSTFPNVTRVQLFDLLSYYMTMLHDACHAIYPACYFKYTTVTCFLPLLVHNTYHALYIEWYYTCETATLNEPLLHLMYHVPCILFSIIYIS